MTRQRTVQTRRVPFRYDGDLDRHYVAGDILLSHINSLSSATFPEGEDFFVRSVRHYRDEITDPELKRQVAGFIGQEAMHGRQHRDFNDRLAAMGYPTVLVDRATRRGLRLLERLASPADCLAVTAALEHVTATFAEHVLSTPEMQELMTPDEDVRALWQWHALEEMEHKAVAFEVFDQAVGDHRLRVRVWRVLLVNLIGSMLLGLAISLARDPDARSVRNLRRSWRFLKSTPYARRSLWDRLRDYERLDFHPDDHDTEALAAEWRERLFGTGTPLAERMASTPV